ncbi:MAG: cell division protein ZapA [Thiobacillaceae bacterium]|nr:cell division protein ZapA [Thiobacillaceae bacterium]MCX7693171.1 cell division protein ZapA [Tepidimonas taiwanensis]MDW8322675.1 cell division protein ZapA [Burkholderiales bacterium]
MANPRHISLDVAIMGREFRVSCPESEREGLLAAVAYLDRKMREIRDSGKVIGLERIAIMAALNITHDYLAARPPAADEAAARDKLQELTRLLDTALAQQDNLF